MRFSTVYMLFSILSICCDNHNSRLIINGRVMQFVELAAIITPIVVQEYLMRTYSIFSQSHCLTE